jgi:two-component system, NtrC family, response regulator HydG
MKKLLIIDDDVDMCMMLSLFLSRKGFKVTALHSCSQAWDYMQMNEPDLVICDVWLQDMDGITFLKKVKETKPGMPFVFITAYDDIKTSANAIHNGALDYVTKPILSEEIVSIVQRALDKVSSYKNMPSDYKATMHSPLNFLYGESELFKRLKKQISLVAPSNYSVTIHGENGTGKKMIAGEIHRCSLRCNQPFVLFNCMMHSHDAENCALFGRSYFIDEIPAIEKGCLELANGGTILFDEITNLSLNTQMLLVKAISEKKITRSGCTDEIAINIRVISTSNKNLWHATQNGKLCKELYLLLNDFTIDLLPIRNRKDDIMFFADHFLQAANLKLAKKISGFCPAVEIVFQNHVWHDNLRELKNVVTKAVMLTESDVIGVDSLPAEICFHPNNGPAIARQQLGLME